MTGRNDGIILGRGNLTATTVAVGDHARATTTGTGTGDAEAGRREIAALAAQLAALLQAAPAGRGDAAEALAAQSTLLAQTAAAEAPNRTMLQMLTGGITQTAAFLKETLPEAVAVAGQLTALVGRLHGIG